MGLPLVIILAFTKEEMKTRHLNFGADMKTAIFHDRQRFIFRPDNAILSEAGGDRLTSDAPCSLLPKFLRRHNSPQGGLST